MVNPRPVDTVLGVVARAPQLSAGTLTSRESRGLRSRAALLRVAMPRRVAGAAHRVQGCSVEQPDLGRAVPQCDALPKAPVVRPIAEPGRQRCRVPAAIGRVAEEKKKKRFRGTLPSRSLRMPITAAALSSAAARAECDVVRPRGRHAHGGVGGAHLGLYPPGRGPATRGRACSVDGAIAETIELPNAVIGAFFCSKPRAAPWWAPALQGCTYKAVESLLTAGSLTSTCSPRESTRNPFPLGILRTRRSMNGAYLTESLWVPAQDVKTAAAAARHCCIRSHGIHGRHVAHVAIDVPHTSRHASGPECIPNQPQLREQAPGRARGRRTGLSLCNRDRVDQGGSGEQSDGPHRLCDGPCWRPGP